MAVQYRQQHRQTLCIEPHCQATRVAMCLIDQRLDLDQQWPGTFLGDQHAGAGNIGTMLRQEDRRGIAHPFQTAVGHRKNTDLVDRAVTVLDRSDQTKTRVRVSLEIKHRVNDVLEHAWTGQGTLLGHMANQDYRDAGLFRQARELRSAFTDLRDRSRCRAQLLGPQRLDRIDYRHLRLRRPQGGQDTFEIDLGEQSELAGFERQASGAHRDLLAGLFAADVKHRVRRG